MAIRAKGQATGPSTSLIGAAILILLAGVCYAVVWRICLKATDGHFTYALDDPYIHLAIARNMVQHRIWGVTPYANSAASSSPLWIVLLCAGLAIGGDRTLWPFAMGVVFSVAATVVLYRRFLHAGLSVLLAVLAAAAGFAIAPFHILPFLGMEHSLQVLLDLVFVFWLYDKWDRSTVGKDYASAAGLAFLICLCRYEDAFLIVVPFCALVWRREWRLAAALAGGAILAIGGFGLMAHRVGMPWLPNSIVLKGTVPNTFSIPWFQALYLHLRGRSLALSDLFVLCTLAGAALRLPGLREKTGALQMLLWTVVVTCLLHAGLAAIGIFYRYEAYLEVLTFAVAVLALKEFLALPWPGENIAVTKPKYLIWVAAVVAAQFVLANIFWFYQLSANLPLSAFAALIVSLVALEVGGGTRGRLIKSLLGPLGILAVYYCVRDRAVQAYTQIPNGCSDVYRQQYQMARFVARYYPSGRVVANDIGALTYFTHIHLLDMWGLASDGVRRLKVEKRWFSPAMKQEIEGFKPDLAILYPQWFLGNRSLPKSLIPVATWTTPPITSVGRSIVMFYAPNPSSAAMLLAQLKEFEPSLPSKVSVRYGADAVSHLPPF